MNNQELVQKMLEEVDEDSLYKCYAECQERLRKDNIELINMILKEFNKTPDGMLLEIATAARSKNEYIIESCFQMIRDGLINQDSDIRFAAIASVNDLPKFKRSLLKQKVKEISNNDVCNHCKSAAKACLEVDKNVDSNLFR